MQRTQSFPDAEHSKPGVSPIIMLLQLSHHNVTSVQRHTPCSPHYFTGKSAGNKNTAMYDSISNIKQVSALKYQSQRQSYKVRATAALYVLAVLNAVSWQK